MQSLLRLQSWLSPAFPTGGFSYSHGLEYAVERGLLTSRDDLVGFIEALLDNGSLRADALLFRLAHDEARAGLCSAAMTDLAELAAASRGSAELHLESTAQGEAFLATVRSAWPSPVLDTFHAHLRALSIPPCLPVAVAAVCATQQIPLEPALPLYLQSAAAQLVSAAVRLVPLGQTDGQRATAALEPAIIRATRRALASTRDDLGCLPGVVEWCSMRHETQYTRLFRS